MVSVVIVNWNTRDLLALCLGALRACVPTPEREVIVVDNASSDGSARMVRETFPEVVLLEERCNWGYARGNNLGFARARGSAILALNPDAIVKPDAILEAWRVLERHPRCGAVGACLRSPDGHLQASVRGFPSPVGIFGDLTGLGRLWPGSVWDSYRLTSFDYESEGQAPQPMGTFLLFRREALAAVGDPARPFDERFPIFFNEVDLLLRLARKGWECWYTPRARVIHHHGAATSQRRKAMIWESHRSLLRYWLKNGGRGTKIALPLLAIGVWIGAWVRARGWDAGFRVECHDL